MNKKEAWYLQTYTGSKSMREVTKVRIVFGFIFACWFGLQIAGWVTLLPTLGVMFLTLMTILIQFITFVIFVFYSLAKDDAEWWDNRRGRVNNLGHWLPEKEWRGYYYKEAKQ